MNLVIGSYGPQSACIGGMVMLPEEAHAMMHELAGKILELKEAGRYCYFRINHANFWGDDYGQIVASLVKTNYSMVHERIKAPFAPNWSPPCKGE
jgi:hypothetical protein